MLYSLDSALLLLPHDCVNCHCSCVDAKLAYNLVLRCRAAEGSMAIGNHHKTNRLSGCCCCCCLVQGIGELPLPGTAGDDLLSFNSLGMFGILSVILLVPWNSGGLASR